MEVDEEFQKMLGKIEAYIQEFGRVVVALSGGVDSSTLAYLCRKVLGEEVFAATIKSQILPSREVANIKKIVKELKIKHSFIDLDILKFESFRRNDSKRCYYCKKIFFKNIIEHCKRFGFNVVFDGTNASDRTKFRPGIKAAKELGIRSPWLELGITKREIRSIAKFSGLSFYNKPSLSCLATRIPQNEEIDEMKLKMVDEAENTLIRVANIQKLKVCYNRNQAIIMVPKNELHPILKNLDTIKNELKRIGFASVLVKPTLSP